MREVLHVVNISGGKDSTATAVLALETQPRDSLRFVFADTGNEHETTIEHVAYLSEALHITIDTLPPRDFSTEIARKRDYVLNHWPGKGVPPDAVARAAAALHPTGNPYLDLCIWKGRFPSPMAQFCTYFLKTEPLGDYQLNILDRGEAAAVWSWQGVRLDESRSRNIRLRGTGTCVKHFEAIGGGVFVYRPILRWRAADCFEAARLYGLKPNPLYQQGMRRVGCMPCINARKNEILEISKRFPGHIERIALWEAHVAAASKRNDSSFFPDPIRQQHLNKRGIHNIVAWSKTSKQANQLDLLRSDDGVESCSSAYGLCE